VIRIQEENPGSYFQELKILKILDVDTDPGSGIFLTLDPGKTSRIRNTVLQAVYFLK
jgi:hypothetical protein